MTQGRKLYEALAQYVKAVIATAAPGAGIEEAVVQFASEDDLIQALEAAFPNESL